MNKVKKYEDRLMEVLRFDDADLEANQAGTLSPRQAAHLRLERRSEFFWITFFGVFFGATIALLLRQIPLNAPGVVPLLVLAAFVATVLVYHYLRRVAPLSKDLHENRALAVDGRVDLSLKPKGRRIKYSMDIGKMRFPIRKDAFLSFKNRDPYCVYYAPHSKQILSVEWLRDDNPFVDEDEETGRLKDRPAY
jgi:hypothetical protein